MQGLSGVQCLPFGQHCSISAAHSTRACIRFERLHILSTQNKFRKLKIAPSLPNPNWVCHASLELEATTDEPDASRTEETIVTDGTVAMEEGPTIQVKFVLQKQCQFGERFNVVGSDPLFGNWDPESAIPMEWADGHIWSAEVDVPVGKQVEFKFVLTGTSEGIEWQPGPNRSFETVEEISPLVVEESWDSADEDASLKLPEESSGLIKETADLSAIADVAGLDEAAKEELVDGIESQIGEISGQPLSSETDSGESSEPVAEVPFIDVNVVVAAVQAAVDNQSAA